MQHDEVAGNGQPLWAGCLGGHRGGAGRRIALDPDLAALWEFAAPLLRVRSNDAHTLYAFGLASALLDAHPEADAAVVLPAIMLHDIGWSQVPPAEVLQAIAPGGGRPDLVLLHEKEGARLAAGILAECGYDPTKIPAILEIIDGHDSRREALSIEDAIVKDADKTWRLSPHGIDTVMDWFGLDRGRRSGCAASACTATCSRTRRRPWHGRCPRWNRSPGGRSANGCPTPRLTDGGDGSPAPI